MDLLPILVLLLIALLHVDQSHARIWSGASSVHRSNVWGRTLRRPQDSLSTRHWHPLSKHLASSYTSSRLADSFPCEEASYPMETGRQRRVDLLDQLRGGYASSIDEADFDGDDEEEDSDFTELDDEAAVLFDQEASLNPTDYVQTLLAQAPPFTKAFLLSSFFATLSSTVLGSKEGFPSILQLKWEKVLTKAQIWRPITAFLNFGPLGLNYLLSIQFCWEYLSALERDHHREPYSFWIMILTGQVCMLVLYPLLGLNAEFLGHNLASYVMYVWSRHYEGMRVNMFGLMEVQAEMLPFLFLAQTFLLEGQMPFLDMMGIGFGAVYMMGKKAGWLEAPATVKRWYKKSKMAERIREEYKKISSDFEVLEDEDREL